MENRPNIKPGHTVLIVDSDEESRHVLESMLAKYGYKYDSCEEPGRALDMVTERPYNLLIVEAHLDSMSGVELFRRAKAADQYIECVVLYDNGHTEDALDAIRAGAYDFMVRPISDLQSTGLTVRHAVERQNLNERNAALIQQLKASNDSLKANLSELEEKRTEVEMFNRIIEAKLEQARKKNEEQNASIERMSRNQQTLLEQLGQEINAALDRMYYFASEVAIQTKGSDEGVELSRRIETDVTKHRQRYQEMLDRYLTQLIADDA